MKNKNEKSIFGTHEWSDTTRNIQLGCKNNCKYCYARSNAARFKQLSPEKWGITSSPLKTWKPLPKTCKKTIMFPSTHDIFPSNVTAYLSRCTEILEQGHRVLITSKARFYCIKRICDNFITSPKLLPLMEFRVSISSAENQTLRFWEPGAPDYQERTAALKYAYLKGFKTSVSLEPFLDNTLHDVVTQNRKFVTDGIWIGKLNKPIARLKINKEYHAEAMAVVKKVMELQTDENILSIYNRYKDDKTIYFKESVMKVVSKSGNQLY